MQRATGRWVGAAETPSWEDELVVAGTNMNDEKNNGAQSSDVQREVRPKFKLYRLTEGHTSTIHVDDETNGLSVFDAICSPVRDQHAHLINAAPELRDALKALCDWDWSGLLIDHPDANEVLKAVRRGEAAVAKAEGRS